MRDYVQELIKLAAEDERAAFQQATQFLAEIGREATHLEQQRALIGQFYTYLATKTGQAGLGPLIVPLRATATKAAPSSPTPQPPGTIAPSNRSQEVRDTALAMVKEGQHVIHTHALFNRMTAGGKSLGVQQPLSVIGTVLSSTPGFSKIDANNYAWDNGEDRPG